jgi:hypothetical protein
MGPDLKKVQQLLELKQLELVRRQGLVGQQGQVIKQLIKLGPKE